MARRLAHLLIAVLLALGWPSSARAGSRPVVVTVAVDNDARSLNPYAASDRDYTSGVLVGVGWPVRGPGRVARYALGVLVGQQMFTPRRYWRADLQDRDRPFAGHLFTGVYWQRSRPTSLDHVQVAFGTVGPASGAAAVQIAVHEALDGKTPRGWGGQLADELVGQLLYRRKWRVERPEAVGRRFGLQLLPRFEMVLGNLQIRAEAGATARVGWRLPDDFGPPRLGDLSDVNAPRQRWTFYAYVGAGAQLVAHDLTITGNLRAESHGVALQPFQGVVEGGLAGAFTVRDHTVTLTYGQRFQTDAFRGVASRTHMYGTLAMAITKWRR